MDDVVARVEGLVEGLADQKHLAALIMPGPNLGYLLGFRGKLGDRLMVGLITVDGYLGMVLPALDVEAYRESGQPADVFGWSDDEGPADAVRRLMSAAGIEGAEGTVAVEGNRLRLVEADAVLDAAPGLDFVDESALISGQRLTKSSTEIDKIRVAVGIAEEALKSAIELISPGVSELELAAHLEYQMRKAGSEGTPFATIVNSGPRGALPHGRASERRVQKGELVLFDFGATYQGYVSDISRTFAVGEVNPELEEIYTVVQEAQAAARSVASPGVAVGEVDAAARDLIADAGFAEYFNHRTGHGYGLEGHEEPYIVAGGPTILEPGMTFTIEPGIYLPGVGGVRIEDDMLVAADGCVSLTSFDRNLIRL